MIVMTRVQTKLMMVASAIILFSCGQPAFAQFQFTALERYSGIFAGPGTVCTNRCMQTHEAGEFRGMADVSSSGVISRAYQVSQITTGSISGDLLGEYGRYWDQNFQSTTAHLTYLYANFTVPNDTPFELTATLTDSVDISGQGICSLGNPSYYSYCQVTIVSDSETMGDFIFPSPDTTANYSATGVFRAGVPYFLKVSAACASRICVQENRPGLTINRTLGVRFALTLAPTLRTLLTPEGIRISWPSVFTNYQVEASTSLLPSGPDWIPITIAPTPSADGLSVQIPRTDAARFFRLRQQ